MPFFAPLRFDRLNRPESARRAAASMGRGRGVLALHVDKGLSLLGEWASERPATITSHVALLLYHSLLESVDSADILLASGAVGPANNQSRTAIETAVSILYLLRRNNEVVSAACLLHEQRHICRIRSDVVEDAYASGASAEVIAAAEAELEEVRVQRIRLENLDHVTLTAARELDRVEAGMASPAHARWHMVLGGPRTVRQLFAEMGRERDYDFVFRSWSEAVHGRTLLQRYGQTLLRNECAPFRALRHYDTDDYVSTITALDHFVRCVTTALVVYMNEARGVEYGRWLVANVEPCVVRLNQPRNADAIAEADLHGFIARIDRQQHNRKARRALKRRGAA
jgi:hypothetical protein